MANRTLARADDNPGEILADGELHKTEELDIGEVEAGASPANRSAPEGKHPWSPSQLDEYEHGPA